MRLAALCASALAIAGCQPGFDYETPVKAALRDPASAQFSDVEVEGKIACGFVNSRNGFGGYAGQVPFVVQSTQATVIDAPSPEKMQMVYDKCPDGVAIKISGWSSRKISEQIEALK